jgi:para-aminobenzoate synthetase component 2
MSRILVVDNYDSFVYTIVGYLQQLGAETEVVRNDAVTESLDGYDGVLVSPGPGTPKEAGASMEIIEGCAERALPMLGVCLGHQALGEVFGGVVTSLPLHGVQFHPEAVLTQGGHRLLANWLAVTGDDGAVARSEGLAPLVRR